MDTWINTGGMVRERIGDRGGGLGKNWGFWKIIYPLKWALAFEMGPQSWIVGLTRKTDPAPTHTAKHSFYTALSLEPLLSVIASPRAMFSVYDPNTLVFILGTFY